MKKIIAILSSFMMIILLTACGGESQPTPDSTPAPTPTPPPEVEYLTVDNTNEIYMDYIEFIAAEAPGDTWGETVNEPCVVIASKLYNDGWILWSVSNSYCELYRDGFLNMSATGNVFGSVIENVTIDTKFDMKIKGTYTFEKSDYVSEYIYDNGEREVVLTDGKRIMSGFSGISDYSKPY